MVRARSLEEVKVGERRLRMVVIEKATASQRESRNFFGSEREREGGTDGRVRKVVRRWEKKMFELSEGWRREMRK